MFTKTWRDEEFLAKLWEELGLSGLEKEGHLTWMGRCELLEVRWNLVALSLSLAETWDSVSFSRRNFRLYTGGRGGGVQTFLRRATPLEKKFWGLFRKIWLPENSTQNTTLWKRKMCNSQNGLQPSKWEGGGGVFFFLRFATKVTGIEPL